MKNRLSTAALLVASPLIIFAGACAAKETRVTSRVIVTGDADVRAQPDTAVVVLSVVTQGAKALDVQRENARKSAAVIQAARETAGQQPDIKTSDYSLQPQYDYGYSGPPRIRSYEARNSVTVSTGEIDNVGAVIDAASRAGANSVDGVSFVLREDNPARHETLAEATRQAMSKAQSIARALGGRVVRVVEQQEAGATRRPFQTDEEQRQEYASMNANTGYAARRRGTTPVEAGPLNVKSQVQLVVEIEARP